MHSSTYAAPGNAWFTSRDFVVRLTDVRSSCQIRRHVITAGAAALLAVLHGSVGFAERTATVLLFALREITVYSCKLQ
jgi:hypothetical protein